MNKLFSVLFLTIALVASAFAQISGTYLYNPKEKTFSPVALTKVASIQKPLGLKLDIGVHGFAGLKDARPTIGTVFSIKQPIAQNLDFFGGPAFSFRDTRLRSDGFVIGFEFKI